MLRILEDDRMFCHDLFLVLGRAFGVCCEKSSVASWKRHDSAVFVPVVANVAYI